MIVANDIVEYVGPDTPLISYGTPCLVVGYVGDAVALARTTWYDLTHDRNKVAAQAYSLIDDFDVSLADFDRYFRFSQHLLTGGSDGNRYT